MRSVEGIVVEASLGVANPGEVARVVLQKGCRTLKGPFSAIALAEHCMHLMLFLRKEHRETQRNIAQGIRYAILVTFLTVVPYSLSDYVVYIVPYQLVIKWMIAGGIQLGIMGLIVAAICNNQRS